MSFRNQSALIFAASLVQLVFGMGAGVLTARFLGPEGKGIAILAFFVPSFLTSLGTLSLGEASTYFLGRGVEPRRIVGNTVWHALILGTVYAAGTIALLGVLRAGVIRDVPVSLAILGLSTLPVMLLKNYGDGVLVGMKRVREFVIGNLTLHLCRGVFLFLALFVFKLDVNGAVGAEFLTWLLVGGVYFVNMTKGHGLAFSIDWPLTKDQVRYGFQAHVGNMAQRANLQVSTVILSSFLGATAIGLFSVAVNLAQVLWYIPDSVGRILFPRVAGSSRDEANRVTALVCRNTILMTLVAMGSLFLVGRTVILFLYGDEFAASVRPLYLLLPGILALAVSKVLTKYLSGIGKPFFNSAASIVSFAANVPLLWFLVRSMGLDGAAIATSIAYAVHALVVIVFFVRESGAPLTRALVPVPGDMKLYTDTVRELWQRFRPKGAAL